MRIEITREGGIAFFPGLSKPRTVDLRELAPEQAESIERCVHAARFFELPSVVGPTSPGGADRTRYTLTIDEDGKRHSVQIVEPVEDPHLRALLDQLREVEKAQRAAERART